MAVPIVSALDNGHTLCLNEYGTYLHPNLAKALVSLFKEDENKTGARTIEPLESRYLRGL